MKNYLKLIHTVKNPPLSGLNPHFKSKYATLTDCDAAVKAASKDCTIVVAPEYRDGVQLMVGWLVDENGRTELASMKFDVPSDPQKAGSAITYYRRYLMTALASISGEEDDDGNAAVPTGLDILRAEFAKAEKRGHNKEDIMAQLYAMYGDPKTFDDAIAKDAAAFVKKTFN